MAMLRPAGALALAPSMEVSAVPRRALGALPAVVALLLVAPVPAGAQGWYMLTPPVGRGAAVMVDAPLARWRPSRAYESARSCEEIRTKWVASLERYEGTLRRARALGTRCIAAGDPRLGPEPLSPSASGWYLLSPPLEERPPPASERAAAPAVEGVAAPTALSAWRHRGSFDTEAECETARRALADGAAAGQPARCVSAGDGRLAPDAARDSPAPR